MARKKGGFADLVRRELEARGQGSVEDLTSAMVRSAPAEMIAGRNVRMMVQSVLRDLVRSEEAIRVSDGVYRFGRRKTRVELRQKMWTILRARRVVSVEDMEELTGASRSYALEWMRMLERQSIVKRLDDGKIQLLHDPIVMPCPMENAEKLRAWRQSKARGEMVKAMEQINKARESMAAALKALDGAEEETC